MHLHLITETAEKKTGSSNTSVAPNVLLGDLEKERPARRCVLLLLPKHAFAFPRVVASPLTNQIADRLRKCG